MHTQGRVPGEARCGKRNRVIGLKEGKEPEVLIYINDFTTSSLRSSSLGGHPQPSILGVNFRLASISADEAISPCALPLIINLVPAFTVPASLRSASSLGKTIQGKVASRL